MRKRRLVRAQQANPAQAPVDQTAVYHFLDTMAKRIEENYFNAIRMKLRYEDLLPRVLDENLTEQTNGMDFHKIVNLPDLIRLMNQEIGRDRSVYDVIKKYLNDKYKIWYNQQPKETTETNPQQFQ